MSAGKSYPFAQMRFLILIFGSGKITIATRISLIQDANPVLSNPSPLVRTPARGVSFWAGGLSDSARPSLCGHFAAQPTTQGQVRQLIVRGSAANYQHQYVSQMISET